MQSSPPLEWRNLGAAFAAITVFGFTFGMTYPLLSLMLEADGVSADVIGLNSAMMPVGILLGSAVVPVATRKFGSKRVAVAAVLATTALVLCFKIFENLAAWFAIRLLLGVSSSTLYVLSEVWIVRFAGRRHRGRIVALYGSTLSASFGAGPAVVGLIGIEGWTPFAVGAGVLAFAVAPLAMIRESPPPPPTGTETTGFLAFSAKAPMLLVAVGVFAIFDAATLSLLPIYGLDNGLDVTAASAALSALILGNVMLQFPIGWFADRFSKRLALVGCAGLTTLFALLLPLVMGTAWMWPALVLLGAVGYGVYTVSLAELGDNFHGHELITGSSVFALVWGIGALVGSIAGGWAVELAAHGLPLLAALVYFVLTAGLAMRTIP